MNPEMEIERLRNLVNRLEKDLNCKGINMEIRVKSIYICTYLIYISNQTSNICISASLVSGQETEIRTLQRKLARRDNEILRQERELHKLRVRDHQRRSIDVILIRIYLVAFDKIVKT